MTETPEQETKTPDVEKSSVVENCIPGPWMLHDVEAHTVVTEEKPGRFIALCDGGHNTEEENAAHAALMIVALETAQERDRLKEAVIEAESCFIKAKDENVFLRTQLDTMRGLLDTADALTQDLAGEVDEFKEAAQARER